MRADRHAYRVQATADGVRAHACPLEFDPRAPYLYFLDVDGSCWIARNPSASFVGLERPPPHDSGKGPALEVDPRDPSARIARPARRDPSGGLWELELPRD